MIFPIEHTVDWELIHQQKQAQLNKYSIEEKKRLRVDHNNKVTDNVMVTKHTANNMKLNILDYFRYHCVLTMAC